MIRVMVVEDEPPIAQSICMLLEEYGDELEVVNVSINGRRALEYLRQNPVDLIFSDIKMPVMSGLELAKEVYEHFPAVTVIIISGYQEFEFARTAIQYGVKDYLLKPVSREGVYRVLSSVSDEIHRRSTEDIRRAMRQIVMSGQPSAKGLPQEKYGMMLTCEGAFPQYPDEPPSRRLAVCSAEELEAYLHTLLPAGHTALVVPGRSVVEKLVLCSANSADFVQDIAEKLYAWLQKASGLPITFLAAPLPVGILQVAESYSTLRGRLYKQVRVFHSTFASGAEADLEETDISDWTRTMLAALKSGSRTAVQDAAEQLAQLLAQHPVRQTRVLMLMEKLLHHSFENRLTLRQMDDLKMEMQACVSGADAPGPFAQDLAELLFEWVRPETGRDSTEEQELCEKVAAFLRANYKDTYSATELAERFGISAPQLSKKFRAHFKQSITEYVSQFRVSLAKAMMREDGKARIKEIAIDVGFADQYYFSKIFKKFEGVWPTGYLAEIQGEE